MPALPGEDASSSPPPELVRSYPNSALSTDSEELLDDEARVDAEAAAAMYGQGDSMHDEDEEPAFRLSSPDIHGGSGSDFSQLRQTIGAMSQEAKEQEAVSLIGQVPRSTALLTRLHDFCSFRTTCGRITVSCSARAIFV